MVKLDTAYFGAGCFWNAELIYSKQNGVKTTEVGYASFDITSEAKQPRVEVVKVEYDPVIVSYDALIDIFWSTHNPENRNNEDPFYVEKSVLFTLNDTQNAVALSKLNAKRSERDGEKILTDVFAMSAYHKAPEKDQKYYSKH